MFFLRLAIQRLNCIFPHTIPFYGVTALNDYGWLKKVWAKRLLNETEPLKHILSKPNPNRYDASKNPVETSLPKYAIIVTAPTKNNQNW